MKQAEINGYVLAVEKLRDYVWWWKVTLDNQIIAQNGSYGKHAESQEQAMMLAEAAYFKHVSKEKIQWKSVE